MPLPNDFEATLTKAQVSGVLDEDEELIDRRLALAVQGAVLKGGQRDLSDLSLGDWTLGTIRKLKATLHSEMCDPEKKALREDYSDLLDKALSPEGVTAVATVITGILVTINPAFAVSNVILFLAIWVLRRGLNRWCSTPA